MHSTALPRRRLTAAAEWLNKLHPLHSPPPEDSSEPSVRVVCISDTHNRQPLLPPGDILIHAGDLTEKGSFDEIQAQLHWLSSQSHAHKIVVAGNHDVLLDEAFLEKYPERRYGDRRTKAQLDWGSVKYLDNQAVRLSVAGRDGAALRQFLVFGSPLTPRYGVFAFQYSPDTDPWEGAIPSGTDILVTHGPAHMHLDQAGFHRAGCQYLGAEVARVRPRLMVFGHIHAAYGQEDRMLDWTARLYDEIMGGRAGWSAVLAMLGGVSFWAVAARLLGRKRVQRVVGWKNYHLRKCSSGGRASERA